MVKYYYAVKNGRNPGIYETWNQCEKEVRGFKNAKYKKFKTYDEALEFIENIEDSNKDYNKNSEIENKEVLIDKLESNEMIAYVDGSFFSESKTYSYGIVIITKEGKETFSGKDNDKKLVEMRNVAGELKGALTAMKIAIDRGMDTLYLHYDYAGIEQWAKGHWKRNKEGTKLYKEYYDSIKDKLNVVFIKVLAHSGVKYNEEADKLAKEAIHL